MVMGPQSTTARIRTAPSGRVGDDAAGVVVDVGRDEARPMTAKVMSIRVFQRRNHFIIAISQFPEGLDRINAAANR